MKLLPVFIFLSILSSTVMAQGLRKATCFLNNYGVNRIQIEFLDDEGKDTVKIKGHLLRLSNTEHLASLAGVEAKKIIEIKAVFDNDVCISSPTAIFRTCTALGHGGSTKKARIFVVTKDKQIDLGLFHASTALTQDLVQHAEGITSGYLRAGLSIRKDGRMIFNTQRVQYVCEEILAEEVPALAD